MKGQRSKPEALTPKLPKNTASLAAGYLWLISTEKMSFEVYPING
jgi:hypothetical protein